MVSSSPALIFTPISIANKGAVGNLFEKLHGNPHFHPHPFTAEEAGKIASRSQNAKDVYVVAFVDNEAVAYGMLRGWDEGYEIPRLGIAVSPNYRGLGFARPMMEVLHLYARLRGAEQVELQVYPNNVVAKKLYESMGYTWVAGSTQLRGVKNLVKK